MKYLDITQIESSQLQDIDRIVALKEDEVKILDKDSITKDTADKVEAHNTSEEAHKELFNSAYNAIESVADKLNTEITDRQTADTDLQSQITAETEARTSADTALRTDVDALKGLPIAQGSGRNSLMLNDIVGNQATGKHSMAEGKSTSATNTSAHSEGSATTASGDSSHSEGHSTVASGISSHSEGLFTQTATKGGHSQGTYNEDDTDAIHTIGIGTSDIARKNSEIVYTSGKKYLYGVGGYDGTKSSIANGAKSIQEVLESIKTEEWTFTLEDGSTVTKNMCYES